MTEFFDIRKFDSYRENNRLEVKAAKDMLPVSLWETYSSFANTDGGCILLGVKERKDKSLYTTGITDADKMKKELWDLLHNPNKVNICLLAEKDVKAYEKDGHLILAIEVPRAKREQKPVYINDNLFGGTYRRDWEGDYLCSRSTVLAMLRDQPDDTPDMKILENKELKDLDQDSIRSYRIRYDARHEGHPWCDYPNEEFLMRIGAASDETSDRRPRPTAAGLLMFGQEYLIMREFPEYFLDYREKLDPSIRWTDRITSQSGDWSGNVYDFFSKVYLRLGSDLKKPFRTEGPYRIDETPVHLAVREALANCLVNTDYFQTWSVVIERYPDRIVMANPGTIRPGREQMLRGGISQPRNKVLLKMFNLIGIGEHAGSGVPDIFSTWEAENYMAPTVEELSSRSGPDRTVVTLPLVNKDGFLVISEKQPEKSPENSRRAEMQNRMSQIFELVKENPLATRASIARELNLSDSQVKTALEKLRKSGRIIHEGPDKGGRWIVHDNEGR